MPRRGDPELIYRAQRPGIFARLCDAERMNELDAEHWIARSEREAETTGRERGSTGFWDEAGGGSRGERNEAFWEVGPIYTANRVIRSAAKELYADLYPTLKDVPGFDGIYCTLTGQQQPAPPSGPAADVAPLERQP